MKYFVLAVVCIAAASAQYHRNEGYAGGNYGNHQSSSERVSGGNYQAGRQGYSVGGAGNVAAGQSITNSDSYGRSGHRMGRSISTLPASERSIAVAPDAIGSGSYGKTGRIGGGHASRGYSQGRRYHGGHRYGRSIVAVAPVVGHGSYSGLASSAGVYGSNAGHGHRMVRSSVNKYGGAVVRYSGGAKAVSQGGYSNMGSQRGDMRVRHN